MAKDPQAPAASVALKYIGKPGDPVGGGLPAANVTADQAAAWYTQAQVDEAIALGSHERATKTEAKAEE